MLGEPTPRPAPTVEDGALVDALRVALHTAGYTVERVESELAAHELKLGTIDLALQRRMLPTTGSFAVLARLFLLGDPVDRGALEQAAAPVGVQGLIALGLCVAEEDRARATVKLVPHGDVYIASDPEAPAGAATPFDYVPGVQAPSVTLAKLAVRLQAESALDLGAGSGLQTLLAARHCSRVVATDINPRALAFAAFNVRLNGLENVELRHGPTFEPVAGERFDLIVSNPPYVISPDASYAYRDSELPGDELCRRVVQAIPAHLTEGGFAHALVSWGLEAGAGWDAPLREWVAESGCDAWLLHYRTVAPLAHAAEWLRPLGEESPALFEPALERWVGYLGERGVDAIAYGAVVLRRRSGGRNWTRTANLPERLEPAGAHTLRVFADDGSLHGPDADDALLAERLALTPHHRLQQTLRCRDGGFGIESATLELTDGLRLAAGLDRYTTLLLPHLDGGRTLAQALAETAASLDLTDEGRAMFVPAALPAVRALFELGFLELRLPN